MYNLTTFIAIVQQARKKPLVTVNLPVLSYTRGWRCEANYDQLLSFGQVTIKWFHRQHDSGDWRWFLKKPILNHKSIAQTITQCCLACGGFWVLFVVFALLTKGYSRALMPVLTNKESQVLAVPGFHNFQLFNCIFR